MSASSGATLPFAKPYFFDWMKSSRLHTHTHIYIADVVSIARHLLACLSLTRCVSACVRVPLSLSVSSILYISLFFLYLFSGLGRRVPPINKTTERRSEWRYNTERGSEREKERERENERNTRVQGGSPSALSSPSTAPFLISVLYIDIYIYTKASKHIYTAHT